MAPTQLLSETRSGFALALSTAALALLTAPVTAQRPQCADALYAGEAMEAETAQLITADLTLDGAMDAAYWWVDGSQVVVLIGTCDGSEVAERWRFVFEPDADCPPAGIQAEAASLLVDEALVERTCAGEQSLSECVHLRRENRRRQALMDAGGRALRVGGPSCTVAVLRWSPHMGGFMQVQ